MCWAGLPNVIVSATVTSAAAQHSTADASQLIQDVTGFLPSHVDVTQTLLTDWALLIFPVWIVIGHLPVSIIYCELVRFLAAARNSCPMKY
jgi:hypothetical protein